jgi:hypothetical protein
MYLFITLFITLHLALVQDQKNIILFGQLVDYNTSRGNGDPNEFVSVFCSVLGNRLREICHL